MAPNRSGANPVGDFIRSERLRRGIKLNDIATATRIPEYLLEAIELGQFHSLPTGVYRCSFLRQYARALGLDENGIVRSFQERYSEPPLPLPEVGATKRRLPPAALLWVPAAAAALFGMYNLWQADMKIQ